jgi:hypothetical protein
MMTLLLGVAVTVAVLALLVWAILRIDPYE